MHANPLRPGVKLETVILSLMLVGGLVDPIVLTEGIVAPIVADIVAGTVVPMIITDLELLVGNPILLAFATWE